MGIKCWRLGCLIKSLGLVRRHATAAQFGGFAFLPAFTVTCGDTKGEHLPNSLDTLAKHPELAGNTGS